MHPALKEATIKKQKGPLIKQRTFLSGAEGIRTNAKTPGNTAFLEKSGAESGALEVLELWPHLSLSQAEAIVRIVLIVRGSL